MNMVEALLGNSFTITGRGIVLELRHELEGLVNGAVLESIDTGKTWKVKSRVLFDHAVHEQKVFEKEFADFILKRFNTEDEKLDSIKNIKEKEARNVYMYLIDPEGHDERPRQGEKLKVKI